MTLWNFYFEIFEEAVRGEHLVVFLAHLQRCISGKLLIVWDGLPAHRGKFVREYRETLEGRIEAYRFPAYAQELNPVEYIWSHLKKHELPNVCPRDLWNFGYGARPHLRRMRRKKRLITAFWKQSSLDL